MPEDLAQRSAHWNYTFKIIFKMKGITERVGQYVVIETAESSWRCGASFRPENSYIIT
ncbi:Hypothetical predicted protein, partial [Mytilus galloprovincialis]